MSTLPLVSCLLCTRDARDLVQKFALPSYLSQDYERMELIVIDSGPDWIEDLTANIPNVKYVNYPGANLAQKRNVGVLHATGDIIVHMDSDDYSGPHRVTDQVAKLFAGRGEVCGYKEAFWWDFIEQRASYYMGSVWGATFCYFRDYAVKHPWDESCYLAEDGPFVSAAREQDKIVAALGGENFVATLHTRNMRRAAVGGPIWPYVGVDALPAGFRKIVGI